MSKQPEREPLALRLASVAIVNRGIGWQADATKELERLHSVNVALLEALKSALDAWNRVYPLMPLDMRFEDVEFQEMQKVRAAIAAAAEEAR